MGHVAGDSRVYPTGSSSEAVIRDIKVFTIQIRITALGVLLVCSGLVVSTEQKSGR